MIIISLIAAIAFFYYGWVFLQNDQILVGCAYGVGCGIFLNMFMHNFPLSTVTNFFSQMIG